MKPEILLEFITFKMTELLRVMTKYVLYTNQIEIQEIGTDCLELVLFRSQNKSSNTCSNITAALQHIYICVVTRHCPAMASVSACRTVGQLVRCGHRELKCSFSTCI